MTRLLRCQKSPIAWSPEARCMGRRCIILRADPLCQLCIRALRTLTASIHPTRPLQSMDILTLHIVFRGATPSTTGTTLGIVRGAAHQCCLQAQHQADTSSSQLIASAHCTHQSYQRHKFNLSMAAGFRVYRPIHCLAWVIYTPLCPPRQSRIADCRYHIRCHHTHRPRTPCQKCLRSVH